MKRKNATNFIALFTALLFLAAFLSSVIFMSHHAGHNCEETTCAVCIQLYTVSSLRKQLAIALTNFLTIGFFLLLFLPTLAKNMPYLVSTSPVNLMVRMNN